MKSLSRRLASSLPLTQSGLVALKFELKGRVQGVYFRKYTKMRADELKLVGFVQNTKRKTVIGECQGEIGKIAAMKKFLGKEGSPKSIIEMAIFDEKPIDKLLYQNFIIDRDCKYNDFTLFKF